MNAPLSIFGRQDRVTCVSFGSLAVREEDGRMMLTGETVTVFAGEIDG